ncbi:RHS repeat-associated core domain-containing protein [Trinickia sp. NRRL B-1857]|uniref:RHS repeat-associated core domain-containing protein n=1 Tax=Trinickia sp. NRRL B-1857 TaxID=3162879 RepID=UPI003D277A88
MQENFVLNYTGAHLDSVTAGYPLGNGARWYIPALMRFNATDSLSPFEAGGINPYLYCDDNPIDRVDPSGHLSWSVTGRAIKRFLARLAAHDKGRSVAAALATDASEGGGASSGERALHAGETAKRPSIVSAPKPHGASAIHKPEWQTLPAPSIHLFRPLTILEKMTLKSFDRPDKILSEQILVKHAPREASVYPLEAFVQRFNVDGTEHFQGAHGVGAPDPLRSRTRVCFPKQSTDSATPNVDGPYKTPVTAAASEFDEDEFNFFPSTLGG